MTPDHSMMCKPDGLMEAATMKFSYCHSISCIHTHNFKQTPRAPMYTINVISYLASFVNRVKNSQLSRKGDFTMNCFLIITII